MIYTYGCKKCEHRFDGSYRMDDRKIPESQPCPSCGEMSVQHLIVSAPKVCYSMSTMKTTDGFNDRLKDIHKKLPERYKGQMANNIR